MITVVFVSVVVAIFIASAMSWMLPSQIAKEEFNASKDVENKTQYRSSNQCHNDKSSNEEKQ